MTGFNSKRDAAADKLQEPINLLEARRIAAEYGTPDSQVDNGNLYFALSKCLEHIDAQPAQEPVAVISAWSLREVYFDEDGEPSMHRSPPQREWVGLTNDEVNNFAAGCHLGKSVQGAIYEAEAKLKEKNT